MLLLEEKGIRFGVCHSRYRHEKANKKYMEHYGPSAES